MMTFLLFAPASAKWLGWHKDRKSRRDRLGSFLSSFIVQSYFNTLLRYVLSATFCGAVILKVMDQKTLVKRRWSYKVSINRGYYTVARRYEFYFRVAKQYFTNERSEWVKYCFCHEKIKFISSSRRVMFFLLYRQKDIDKVIEGNDRNYVIDKLTSEIMENKPLGSRM